jgi:hydroxyethylthiazole kinase-like uncharacterized protein yjeF
MSFTALYRIAQIRAIEQAAFTVVPSNTLMQRAGQAVADAAIDMLGDNLQQKQILVLAGPGNNGGDALQAAAQLAQQDVKISIVLMGKAASLPADAHNAYSHACNSPAEFISAQKAIEHTGWDLIIDGLFGIGLQRSVEGSARELIEAVNARHIPVLAIDIPTGLDADTGCVIGPNGIAIEADRTITFIANKPGLFTSDGRDYAGTVELDSLAIDPAIFNLTAKLPAAELNSPELFLSAAQKRRHASHKGSYGDVAIIGGAAGMTGATILAARMAACAGAGRVFAGFIDMPPAYDSLHPELMCRAANEIDLTRGTLVIGPGLGMARHAHDLLSKALSSDQPLVLDADALNIIANEAALQIKLSKRQASTILTPHPLEAARLLNSSSADIQADRLHAAAALAAAFNSVIILKGSGSVIAHPDGRLIINTTGNPALATAGSGDVLAGLCGALIAQNHIASWEAALAATWLHGDAADRLVSMKIGPIGLTASEFIPEIRNGINQLQH